MWRIKHEGGGRASNYGIRLLLMCFKPVLSSLTELFWVGNLKSTNVMDKSFYNENKNTNRKLIKNIEVYLQIFTRISHYSCIKIQMDICGNKGNVCTSNIFSGMWRSYRRFVPDLDARLECDFVGHPTDQQWPHTCQALIQHEHLPIFEAEKFKDGINLERRLRNM